MKFKVQGCDDIKELCVPHDETVGGFIKCAQLAGLVPGVGICNVVLCDQSGDLFSGDCPISLCQCQVVYVLWDECHLSTCDGKLPDQGNAEARYSSDACLKMGWDSAVDPVMDFLSFCKFAADSLDSQGLDIAQHIYAEFLENGIGVPVDLASAARYYKLAADQGLADAQYNYGLCLENGTGVSVDLASAARYFKLAADQGVDLAQYNYGVCLENGTGVSVDLASAARYYKLAADQ